MLAGYERIESECVWLAIVTDAPSPSTNTCVVVDAHDRTTWRCWRSGDPGVDFVFESNRVTEVYVNAKTWG